MWPMVYQGLGVYREPVQRHTALAASQQFGALPGDAAALSSLPSLDSIPYAHRGSDTGRPHMPYGNAGLTRRCLILGSSAAETPGDVAELLLGCVWSKSAGLKVLSCS